MPLKLTQNVEPIPGYTLIERLGSGGFGEVWKARAPGGIPKAIKFVHGCLDEKTGNVPAEQELKALTRVKSVRHPFILGLERVDVIDGQVIIVMELADRSIWDRFKECQSQGFPGIPRPELLRYMNEAAEALDLMNGEYQLQHLDIKPQNLFLVRNHVKVADFGLVKDLDGKSATVTSGITPVYAAPETFEGRVSQASDQYSLAIVYQELLTGRRPFDGKNARQLLMQHVSQMPDLAPLPAGDRDAVARCLAKHVDDRYPTCSEFVRDLRNSIDTELPDLEVPPPPEFNPDEHSKSPVRGGLFSSNTPGADATPSEPDPTKTQLRRPSRQTLTDFDASKASGEPAELWQQAQRPKPSLLPLGGQAVPRQRTQVDPALLLQTELTAPPLATKDPCPRCGKVALDPVPSAWCTNCGYSKDVHGEIKPPKAGKGKAAKPGEEPKDTKPDTSIPLPGANAGAAATFMFLPGWAWVLLAGMTVFTGATVAAEHFFPPNSQHRAIASTAELVLGMLGFIAGPWVALRMVLAAYDDLVTTDVLFPPSRLFMFVVKLLPETRWSIWLTGWGVSLLICGLVLGGYEYWWTRGAEVETMDPSIRRALEQAERQNRALADSTKAFKPVEGLDGSSKTDKRPVLVCAVVGLVPDFDQPDRFSSLLVLVVRDGVVVSRQTISAKTLSEDTQAYLNSHFNDFKTREPSSLWKGDMPGGVQYVDPNLLGVKVRYKQLDENGGMIEPMVETLLRR
jgi:serine/threonine protein kinase